MILFLGIIAFGIININIKWTRENIHWNRPYRSSNEKMRIDGALDTEQYALDNSPLKIFVGSEDIRDIRVIFKDYNMIINESSVKELNESFKRGVRLTNSHLKNYIYRIIDGFKR